MSDDIKQMSDEELHAEMDHHDIVARIDGFVSASERPDYRGSRPQILFMEFMKRMAGKIFDEWGNEVTLGRKKDDTGD